MPASTTSIRSDTVRIGVPLVQSVTSSLSPQSLAEHDRNNSKNNDPHSPGSDSQRLSKRVTWNTVDMTQRSTLAEMLSRNMDKGLLRVFYGIWYANVQHKRLHKVNQSLQRMLGDGSKCVDAKVKTLQDENSRKAEKIRDLQAKLKSATRRSQQHASTLSLKRDNAASLHEKDLIIASLRAQILQKDEAVNTLTHEVSVLKRELTKANDAILNGADEFHTVNSSLQRAQKNLQVVRSTLSPERIVDAVSSPEKRQHHHRASSQATADLLPARTSTASASAAHRSRTVAVPVAAPPSPWNSVAGMGISPTPLHAPEPSPTPFQSMGNPSLSVEHHLSELIKERGLSGGGGGAVTSKAEARSALGLVLHQVQMQRTLAEHRHPEGATGESEGLAVLQTTLRGLISGSK